MCLYECNGDADQQWVYDHDGYAGEANDMDTIWLATSDDNGNKLCMDVAGGGIWDNGNAVQAWDCYGGDNQEWTLQQYYNDDQ